MKIYELKHGRPRTLAGIGFFGPRFIASSERMIEKIENSVHFKKGGIVLCGNDKEEPIEAAPEVIVPPVETEIKLSRRAIFAKHGEKMSSAPHLAVQRIALEVGATENEIAGLPRAKLMKLIRDRTVA